MDTIMMYDMKSSHSMDPDYILLEYVEHGFSGSTIIWWKFYKRLRAKKQRKENSLEESYSRQFFQDAMEKNMASCSMK